jgi:HD-GYP domain-containing protein (c-di-GMP phosphodiesterase class II)
MNRELRFVLPPLWAAGAVVVWVAVRAFTMQTPHTWETNGVWFSVLLVLAILSEMKPVPYTLGHANKDESLTITIILLTLFALDWPAAVLLAASSVVVADLVASKPYYKVLFNGSMYALSTLAAGVAYHAGLLYLQTAPSALPAIWGQQLLARFVAGAVYYFTNVTLLMLVLSRVQGLRLGQMIAWGLRDSAAMNLALITIATAMMALWELHPAAAVILVPAILTAKAGYQGYTRLRLEAEAMLATLADLLDLRDHNTGLHSLRVSETCYGVARLLGLPEEQALAIRAIARVHDVGKVAVRDAVLLKVGPLSPHERLEAQGHVETGGRILSHLSVYRQQLPILLQHHERMDGRGYPTGVPGDSIEVGARILAACDVYDSLTSDRPYRAAMSSEAAMGELHRHAGSRFDPKVVAALERLLIQERKLSVDWRDLLPAASSGDGGTPPLPRRRLAQRRATAAAGKRGPQETVSPSG